MYFLFYNRWCTINRYSNNNNHYNWTRSNAEDATADTGYIQEGKTLTVTDGLLLRMAQT